ncbi:CDP-glycerol glycerophosphotransferase family protein [Helicobacter turcicus]|uniref:CDP-glycerol glycerophosphotransferase family protein n=1 Tax=Helicobacter turcicus TaxID=2867412 RepID=UPI001C879390|nr:CDP-glycerol glycerophosphotransferase family protein [Helicobacter turcicus]MBX7546024.1 CDP-glycerol glycerophosphotransferase family protein [Helicobacter turcicus]
MKILAFWVFYLWAMKIYHKDKNYGKALEFYEKARKFNPSFAKNYFKMGMCYHKMQDYANAEFFIQKALELKPQNSKWKKQLSVEQSSNIVFIQAQRLYWKDIIDIETELREGKKSFILYFELAGALLEMHRFLQSAKAYEEALKFCKDKGMLSKLYYEMGFAYEKASTEEQKEEYLTQAKEAYKKATLYDEDFDSKRYGVGVFHEQNQRWEFAKNAYLEKIYKQDSKDLEKLCLEDLHTCEDSELFYKVARVFDILSEHERAEFFFEKALEINYQNAQTHYYLGIVCEKQGKFEKASFAYKEAVRRQNSFKSEWFYRLGLTLQKVGKKDEALKTFESLQTINFAPFIQISQGAGGGGFMMNLYKNKTLKQRAMYTHFYENLELEWKTILYESFHGRLMSCNPYAIFKALLKDERFKDYTHIWVISDSSFIQKKYAKLKNLILVSRNSDLYLRYLASAKYLINNTTFPPYFLRKEGQLYLNTWHGTALKTLGKHIKTSFMEHNNTQRNFLQSTHIINPNAFMQDVLLKDYDIDEIYSGKALISGYARVDLSLKKAFSKEQEEEFTKEKQSLKEHFCIKEGEKVLLYAPTFRGHFGNADFAYENITKLLQELSVMPFKVLFKGHYETLRYIEDEEKRICDANDREIDTNELLSIVDILITDYSSIAFDFMPLNRPIIFFAYDYMQYQQQRGMYFNFQDLGIKPATSIKEVKALLSDTNFLNVKEPFAHLKERFFPLDDGLSTQRVIDFFFFGIYDESKLFKNMSKKTKLLFFQGGFMANGITSAFKNLIANVDREKFSIHLAIEGGIDAFPERLALFNEVKDSCKVLPKVGTLNLSFVEYELMRNFFIERNAAQEKIFAKAWQREFRRLYGESRFDSLIQYDGYNRYFSYLFAYAEAKKFIYLHNDMQGEFYKRFPYLRGIFYLYKRFDALLSVSEQTTEQNAKNLALSYGINEDKFKTAFNFINDNEVLEKSKLPLTQKDLGYFKKDYTTFINIARLSVEKDQTSLIEAFVSFHKEFPKTRLLILGDGPLKKNLEILVKKLQAEKYIFLLGFAPNPYNFLKQSDIFVLSSQHEGQALVLAEAMILHKKILCTDFACAKDFLGENAYGLVVPRGSSGILKGLKEIYTKDFNFLDFDVKTYNEKRKKEFQNFFGEKIGE